MSKIRRIYRRVTTTEGIVALTKDIQVGPINGETFRVEVFVKNDSGEELVYQREHTGGVKVEEALDGNFRLIGTVDNENCRYNG